MILVILLQYDAVYSGECVKKKVQVANYTLEQELNAQKGSRYIRVAILFL